MQIHGTCLGFQLLHILASNVSRNDLLVDTDSVAHPRCVHPQGSCPPGPDMYTASHKHLLVGAPLLPPSTWQSAAYQLPGAPQAAVLAVAL